MIYHPSQYKYEYTEWFANLSNFLTNDMEKIQKCTLSIIYPFTSYEDTQAKAGITRLKQCSEDAYVNFVKWATVVLTTQSPFNNC